MGHFQIVGCVQGNNPALAEKGYLPAELIRFFHVVSGQENCYTLSGQFHHQATNLASYYRV